MKIGPCTLTELRPNWYATDLPNGCHWEFWAASKDAARKRVEHQLSLEAKKAASCVISKKPTPWGAWRG